MFRRNTELAKTSFQKRFFFSAKAPTVSLEEPTVMLPRNEDGELDCVSRRTRASEHSSEQTIRVLAARVLPAC